MKLYFFECGILRSEKGFFIANAGSVGFDVPVPFFLIEHEKGYVLFDSGHNVETIDNQVEFLGEALNSAYNPKLSEDQYVLSALKKANVSPDEIKYVICSHLHFDHAGGIGLFPNAKYILQKDEIHYAYVPDNFMVNAYKRADFDKSIDWVFLDKTQKIYDVFGDGKIIIYSTPGHTQGHQSVLVNLEKRGPMFLAADACYTEDNLKDSLLSGLACDNSAYLDSLAIIKNLEFQGAEIVTGHDPKAWPKYKQFPEFYE